VSILSRFSRTQDPELSVPELPQECGHWELAPRWENAADMGKKDKITFLVCTNCKETFSPDEAERLAVA
jgi:hypothetical protein